MDFDLFRAEVLSIEMQSSITKWGCDDLEDAPEFHRWRAQWDNDGAVISLSAFPVLATTPKGVWIDKFPYRVATKQPWEDGAPGLQWVQSKHRRWVSNDGAQAWAKKTQDAAIHSIAVRLTKWANHVANDRKTVISAARSLSRLRPDLERFAKSALASLGEE